MLALLRKQIQSFKIVQYTNHWATMLPFNKLVCLQLKGEAKSLNLLGLTCKLLNINPCTAEYPAFVNSVDPDQLASEEAN